MVDGCASRCRSPPAPEERAPSEPLRTALLLHRCTMLRARGAVEHALATSKPNFGACFFGLTVRRRRRHACMQPPGSSAAHLLQTMLQSFVLDHPNPY
jgi:hypothetical protein